MLRFRNVTKRFGEQLVLDDLELVLPFQGATFVMGPSGAGKSVLSQLAVGLLRPDAGEVLIDDVALDALPERKLRPMRKRLGYVAQGPALLDWLSLRDNVAVGPRRVRRCGVAESLERAERAMREVGIAEYAERRPTEVGPGTQKRAALARALASDPAALILDEPTTGLEPRAARQVDRAIAAAVAHGTAAIVVSHDLISMGGLAERVVVLHRGRIGFDGPQHALRDSASPAVRALLEGDANG